MNGNEWMFWGAVAAVVLLFVFVSWVPAVIVAVIAVGANYLTDGKYPPAPVFIKNLFS